LANPFLEAASTLYGGVQRWRRDWYTRDRSRQHRLSRPVISVGNLRVGGSGKTPIVESIARLIVANGGRPAILTRGYGRRVSTAGVTVVSDGSTILADVFQAGDEPLMLARHLPGVPVLVGADRCESGRVAERRFGATIHLLDDGFQHLGLARELNLLAIAEDDLFDRVLPAGRLREQLNAAAAADALLADGSSERVARFGHSVGVETVFTVVRSSGHARWIDPGDATTVPADRRIFAIAAIARPERFFRDIVSAGWVVAGKKSFRDHHWFTERDMELVAREARAVGAELVLTTEKDAVRLETCDRGQLPFAYVPLTVRIEPADLFSNWLFSRVPSLEPRASNSPASSPQPPASSAVPPAPSHESRASSPEK
jgi:tetraacyldisaccharide 4'-kinase